jgi:hypothetical protein
LSPPPKAPLANWAAILAAMAAAAAAASDAVFDSSVLAAFGVVPSSPGAGWSHFRLEGLEGSAGDML